MTEERYEPQFVGDAGPVEIRLDHIIAMREA